jgi:hypothetical protein
MAKHHSITTRAQRTTTASLSTSPAEPARVTGGPPPEPGTEPAPAAPDPGPVLRPEDETRLARLAEMVAGLTECDPAVAAHAVRAAVTGEPALDPLDVVAHAVMAVQSPAPERFRIPAYVRPDDASRRLAGMRAARRARATATQAVRPAAPAHEPALVAGGPGDGPEWTDDVIFDLRVEHARVRIDLTRLDRAHRRRRR